MSFLFLFSYPKFNAYSAPESADACAQIGSGSNAEVEVKNNKRSLSCWCVFKWGAIGLGVYLCANVLFRILTKIALFCGSLRSIGEDTINYGDDICFEDITEEINGKNIIIGRKFWCNNLSDCDLKGINVIFFNGNGGSVLNDNMHLGSDGKMIYLTRKGAIVYAIDRRGYGNRKNFFGPLSMSESTIFEDGEHAFNYVLNKTGRNQKIIVAGYSLGGQVAIHVWRYAQEKRLEHKLAGIILHSPLNNFNKVAGEIFKPLEWILNFMFINRKEFKEIEKLKPTEVPSYWCSGFTKDFVNLGITVCGKNSSKEILGDIKREVSDHLYRVNKIKNARVIMNNSSHMGNFSTNPSTSEEEHEFSQFNEFLSSLRNYNGSMSSYEMERIGSKESEHLLAS